MGEAAIGIPAKVSNADTNATYDGIVLEAREGAVKLSSSGFSFLSIETDGEAKAFRYRVFWNMIKVCQFDREKGSLTLRCVGDEEDSEEEDGEEEVLVLTAADPLILSELVEDMADRLRVYRRADIVLAGHGPTSLKKPPAKVSAASAPPEVIGIDDSQGSSFDTSARRGDDSKLDHSARTASSVGAVSTESIVSDFHSVKGRKGLRADTNKDVAPGAAMVSNEEITISSEGAVGTNSTLPRKGLRIQEVKGQAPTANRGRASKGPRQGSSSTGSPDTTVLPRVDVDLTSRNCKVEEEKIKMEEGNQGVAFVDSSRSEPGVMAVNRMDRSESQEASSPEGFLVEASTLVPDQSKTHLHGRGDAYEKEEGKVLVLKAREVHMTDLFGDRRLQMLLAVSCLLILGGVVALSVVLPSRGEPPKKGISAQKQANDWVDGYLDHEDTAEWRQVLTSDPTVGEQLLVRSESPTISPAPSTNVFGEMLDYLMTLEVAHSRESLCGSNFSSVPGCSVVGR